MGRFDKLIELVASIGSDLGVVTKQATPLLLEGLKMTLLVSVVSIAIGLIVGLITCLMKLSKYRVLRGISKFYIWVVRGTPMLVQAYFIFFGVNQLIAALIPGYRMSILQASIITVSLNAGAYMAEIYRSGINSVPKGQAEAARSLGLGHWRTMQKIVLPQAIRMAIPSLVNQFIITIKDTSLMSVIGLTELTNRTKVYVSGSYKFFASYLYVALFYLAIISVLMIISQKVEKSINYERKN